MAYLNEVVGHGGCDVDGLLKALVGLTDLAFQQMLSGFLAIQVTLPRNQNSVCKPSILVAVALLVTLHRQASPVEDENRLDLVKTQQVHKAHAIGEVSNIKLKSMRFVTHLSVGIFSHSSRLQE